MLTRILEKSTRLCKAPSTINWLSSLAPRESTGSQKTVALTSRPWTLARKSKNFCSTRHNVTGQWLPRGLLALSSSMSLAESSRNSTIRRTLEQNGSMLPTMCLILNGDRAHMPSRMALPYQMTEFGWLVIQRTLDIKEPAERLIGASQLTYTCQMTTLRRRQPRPWSQAIR